MVGILVTIQCLVKRGKQLHLSPLQILGMDNCFYWDCWANLGSDSTCIQNTEGILVDWWLKYSKACYPESRRVTKKEQERKKPSVATLWKIFSPQSHTLGKWQLGNNGPKLWLFLTCSDGSEIFFERNNMHFACKLNCAPKTCQLWCPLGQLGCNREEVVLTYEKEHKLSLETFRLCATVLFFSLFYFFFLLKEVKKWSR